jgi:hypothetical protein
MGNGYINHPRIKAVASNPPNIFTPRLICSCAASRINVANTVDTQTAKMTSRIK